MVSDDDNTMVLNDYLQYTVPYIKMDFTWQLKALVRVQIQNRAWYYMSTEVVPLN